jgi:hypothetical protein
MAEPNENVDGWRILARLKHAYVFARNARLGGNFLLRQTGFES